MSDKLKVGAIDLNRPLTPIRSDLFDELPYQWITVRPIAFLSESLSIQRPSGLRSGREYVWHVIAFGDHFSLQTVARGAIRFRWH